MLTQCFGMIDIILSYTTSKNCEDSMVLGTIIAQKWYGTPNFKTELIQSVRKNIGSKCLANSQGQG